MKFSCEACAARYYMDDEKVRHKTLRIRCKKCGNVMTVGDGATTLAEEGSGLQDVVSAPLDSAQTPPDAIWFYAAAGQTYGPYSEPELLRRFETGRIAEEVHVWRQGYSAWLPANQVEGFAAAIAAAVPVRQPTQSIDISELLLAPIGARSELSPTLPSAPSQAAGEAEAKARLTALRDGLRKSRAAEVGVPLKASGPPTADLSFGASDFGSPDVVDGSVADATASLVANASSPATVSLADAPKTGTEEARSVAAELPATGKGPTPPPVLDSSSDLAALSPAGVGPLPRLQLLADAAVLPPGQAPSSSAMASALNAAPSASLMHQVNQSKAANRRRLLLGVGGFAALVIAALLLTRGGGAPPKPAPSAESLRALPTTLALTPEQLALKADRTDSAVSTAKLQLRGAIREGASSAVTAIMKKRMADEAAARKRGIAAVKKTTKVVFDEATGAISEQDGDGPAAATGAGTSAAATTRARGIGVAIAAPKLGRVRNAASLPSSYFQAGLRKVEESIQYCNQRQLSAEGRLRKPRVELKLSILPSGRVGSLELNQEVSATTFAGCMRGRKDRWIFGAFEGEPLQIAKTYIVE